MASPRRIGGGIATVEEGASALGDAFQTVARGLAHLQDALRLQEQEAERRLQEALRLQEQEAQRTLQEALRLQEDEAERRLQEALRLQGQRAASSLSEAMRQSEEKLQEKDSAIRALQQRFEVFELRLTAMKDEAISSEVSGKDEALQLLEGRVQKVEGSLQRAMDTFFPCVEALLRQMKSSSAENPPAGATSSSGTGRSAAGALEVPSLSRKTLGATYTVLASNKTTTYGSAADARVEPSSTVAPGTSTSASDASASALESTAPGTPEEERERQHVQHRMRVAEERRYIARASPCYLGEQLCTLAGQGKMNDVRHYLDICADANYINRNGNTPLQCAFIHGDRQTVSLLLQRGADANTVIPSGVCALHFASVHNVYCVPLLIRAGADVDARDADGATPLHRAASQNRNELAVRALLVAGARRDLKGWGGVYKDKTPFDVATSDALRHLLRP